MRRNIGPWIRERRTSLGLSQADLTPIVGIREAEISDIEQGKRLPTRDVLERMFAVFHLGGENAGYGFLLAGYPPLERDIDLIVQQTDGIWEDANYPIVLKDFTGRLVNTNYAAAGQLSYGSSIRTNRPQELDLLYDDTLRAVPGWQKMFQQHLNYFVADTPFNMRDGWYREKIGQYFNDPLFLELWRNALEFAETDYPLVRGFRDVDVPVVTGQGIELRTFHRLSSETYDPRFIVDKYVAVGTPMPA